ncbi:MAG: DNA-directed RNA polymerase subunit alpha [Victivallales bacterium]|nr:DNA-directed RNA polymerase subunit alpha [Victivallales bacterium]
MAFVSGFPVPKSIKFDEGTATGVYGRFTIEPLQAGFGHTLGNSLRRVLLSSLEGAAIQAVRIDGVSHEFATMPHVIEDVTEIVLNLKKVKVLLHSDSPKVLELRKDSAGAVTAGDIITDGTVEILNPEQVICTLDKKVSFRAELEISKGRGYVPAENNKREDHPIGTIPIDSLYSPVSRVRYDVGAARVGEETEMDSLHMEIWTDGRVDPQSALEDAAKIMQEHLKPFLGGQMSEDDSLAEMTEPDQELYKVLMQPVENLELSVRAQNCLNNADIKILGELCSKTDAKMLKYRNFGKKSLDEIKSKLESFNLSLGMQMSDELLAALDTESRRLRTPLKNEN